MDNELKELLKDYHEIEKLLKSRVQERGMDFYVPNPAQMRVHKSKCKTIAYTGGNRCLPLNTPILMSDGKFKKLEDVNIGDKVVSENGFGIVVNKINSGKKLCYKVNFEDGGYLIASIEHEFPISFGSGKKFIKRRLQDLIGRKKVTISKKARFLSYKNIEFENKNIPLHPYLLGVLLGDGTLKGGFGFTNSDIGIITRLDNLLRELGYYLKFCKKYHYRINSISKIPRKSNGQFGLNNLREKFRKLGLDKTAKDKFIPDCYKYGSVEVRKQILSGLIDTDGSLDEFTSVSERLAKDVVYIIKSLGGKATLKECFKICYNSPTKKSVKCFRIYWRLNDDLYLTRKDKQKHSKREVNYNTRVVRNIEEVGVLDCGDITISNPSHNFVSWDWIVTGNSGKSSCGAMEICWAVTKKYPEWFPKERRFNRPVKIRIATDKFFKIDSVIEPKIRSYLPANEITQVRRSPQGYINKLHTKDGSFIEFLTMEQDEMAFEGQDLDLFWGDEPVERRRYVATQRGLIDRGGQTILTFTPLIEPWMKEEIVDKADGKKIDVINADIRDNRFDVEGNPILKEEDIQKFEEMLTDDEKETRLHGKFFHLKGVVYKELCDQHLIDAFKYETGYPVICVLDPHDRLPHHLIWAMIDRINDIYVMYELVREGTIQELAASIKATEKFYGWNVVKRLIDPNFGRKPLLSTGLSVIDELYKYKCSFSEANDSKEAGHLKVKELLHFNRNKPIDIQNKPKLFFVRNQVPKTIHSMMNYQYDEWKGNIDKDPKEDGKQKDCHGADVIRYLVLSNPQFHIPSAYEPQLQEAYY